MINNFKELTISLVLASREVQGDWFSDELKSKIEALRTFEIIDNDDFLDFEEALLKVRKQIKREERRLVRG